MTTFAERKAARKASGNRKFVFELVRTFESRKQAEQFAKEQLNGEGDTMAYKAWHAMQPRNEVKPYVWFEVTRVEVMQ